MKKITLLIVVLIAVIAVFVKNSKDDRLDELPVARISSGFWGHGPYLQYDPDAYSNTNLQVEVGDVEYIASVKKEKVNRSGEAYMWHIVDISTTSENDLPVVHSALLQRCQYPNWHIVPYVRFNNLFGEGSICYQDNITPGNIEVNELPAALGYIQEVRIAIQEKDPERLEILIRQILPPKTEV